MAYSERIKADSKIFENIQSISVGDEIILSPIIANKVEKEAEFYLLNTNNLGVKEYLPDVFVESKEQAVMRLLDFSSRMLLKQSLFYCIRFKERPFPIGYIHLNTPLITTGLESWTVDFWMADFMQSKGIMSASLYCTLAYLQKHNVPDVKALVSATNTKSINTLERVRFEFVSQEGRGEKRFLYSVQLN